MRNWGGLGGLLFGAGILGVFSLLGDGPAEESAKAAATYYGDKDAVSVHVLFLVSAIGLIWFASALYRVTGSILGLVAMVGGAVGLLVTDAILLTPFEANEMDGFSNDVSMLEMFDNLAYFTMTNAHVLVGVGAIAVGWWARRGTAGLPVWAAWFSVVTGVIALASAAFMPMLLVWLWAAVIGLLLVLRAPTTTEPVVATTTRDAVPA